MWLLKVRPKGSLLKNSAWGWTWVGVADDCIGFVSCFIPSTFCILLCGSGIAFHKGERFFPIAGNIKVKEGTYCFSFVLLNQMCFLIISTKKKNVQFSWDLALGSEIIIHEPMAHYQHSQNNGIPLY